MATYYYDYASGNNGNDGLSTGAPKQTIGNTATLTGGDRHLFKRGSVWPVGDNAANRIGIVGTTGTSEVLPAYIGAYGSGALPIFDGQGTGYRPVWIRHGSYITIEDLRVIRGYTDGLSVYGNSASENPMNITIRRCEVTDNSYQNLQGLDGISIRKAVGAALTQNILIEDCTAWDNKGHGIKARLGTNNTVMRRCYASGNGRLQGSHGIGSAGIRAPITGWSLVSGTTYQATLTPATYEETANITALDFVFCYKAPYWLLADESPSLTPSLGAFSVTAANTIRVNVGENPTGITGQPPSYAGIESCYKGANNVLLDQCISEGNLDPVLGIEGHGFAFDDFSMNVTLRNCISRNNLSLGISFNRNQLPVIEGCYLSGNGYGAVKILSPKGIVTIRQNTLTSPRNDTAQSLIEFYEGGLNLVLQNNILIGGKASLWDNAVAITSLTEKSNCFYGYSPAATALHVGVGGFQAIDATSFNANPAIDSRGYPANVSLYGAGTNVSYPGRLDVYGCRFQLPLSIGSVEPNPVMALSRKP